MGARPALLAIVFALLAAPAAAAQPPAKPTVEWTVEDLPGLIVPEAGTGMALATLSFSCSQDEFTAGFTNNVIVEFAHGPVPSDNMLFTLSPTTVTKSPASPEQCVDPDHRREVETTATVLFNRRSPAFETQTVPLLATIRIRTNGGEKVHGPYVTNLSATPDFLPIVEIQPDSYTTRPGSDGKGNFTVTLRNFGNAETRFTFRSERLSRAPFNVTRPDPIVVPVGGEAPVFIEASVPNGAFEEKIHTFTVFIEGRSTNPLATRTDEQAISLSVVTQAAVGAPGLEAALALTALGWFALRRRPT